MIMMKKASSKQWKYRKWSAFNDIGLLFWVALGEDERLVFMVAGQLLVRMSISQLHLWTHFKSRNLPIRLLWIGYQEQLSGMPGNKFWVGTDGQPMSDLPNAFPGLKCFLVDASWGWWATSLLEPATALWSSKKSNTNLMQESHVL